MREESENIQAIVDGDQNHALRRQPLAIDKFRAAVADLKGATVNPDHHRQLRACGFRRRPHIQVQAVFARGRMPPVESALRDLAAILHAHRRKLVGFAHALPGNDRFRFTPA